MALFDSILGESSSEQKQKQKEQTRQTGEYDEVGRLDEPTGSETSKEAEMIVQSININQNTDVIQAKDEIRNGNIVIADISQLSSGLSEERVLGDLEEAVNDVNGDIAMQNTDEHVILAPAGVAVSRRVL